MAKMLLPYGDAHNANISAKIGLHSGGGEGKKPRSRVVAGKTVRAVNRVKR